VFYVQNLKGNIKIDNNKQKKKSFSFDHYGLLTEKEIKHTNKSSKIIFILFKIVC
jgi:hypothetical protein